jgi:hypothetical protein
MVQSELPILPPSANLHDAVTASESLRDAWLAMRAGRRDTGGARRRFPANRLIEFVTRQIDAG